MQAQFFNKLRNRVTKNSDKGFTLSNLLMAGFLGITVAAVGGYGVVQMVTATTTTNAQTERRTELNRAMTFLKSETQIAQRIHQDASDVTNVPATFNPTAAGINNAERVLMLQVEGVSEPVIYYLGDPIDAAWSGPKIIYRWGPEFDGVGTYTNATNPSSWVHQPLIDNIETIGTTPSCPASWTGNGAPGFYACVNPTEEIVQVQQLGRINKVLGQQDAYAVTSQMAVRQSTIAPQVFTPQAGATFNEDDGEIIIGANATMRIEVMGGAITCGADGPNIPTRASLNLTTGNTTSHETVSSAAAVYTWNNVPAGSSLDITGISEGDASSGDCNGEYMEANSSSGSSLVLTLQNGDTVPNYVPFGNQPALDTYLSSIIDTNGNVSLAGNEVVFLYELGETDSSSPAFDMQDLVVRATITPTSTTN